MKIGKHFLLVVVLIFALVFSTTINAFETSKINNEKQENDIPCDCTNLKFNSFTKSYKLLNGKYAVMTERTVEPKTEYDYYAEPQLTKSYFSLPSQFSWTNYGGDWTTPAKDQGGCGSCWAFSALSTMEAQINIASGYPDTDLDLSEQYILSCLPYGGSCSGGWTDDAFHAIMSTGPEGNNINGVCIESCMPYQANDYLPCSEKCANWNFVDLSEDGILWEMESWGANHNLENDDPNDRDIVKGYIMDYGPLSASMYATSAFSSFWNTHHDPNDWYFEEDYYHTNHAVLLVGWKDDPSVTNGGYWILKNSWGTSWGYNGFFNAAYGGQKIGEIVRWCKTPEWPEEEQGPGPVQPVEHVFADFDFDPGYPLVDETIQFYDRTQGNPTLWEWDFDGDGVIDISGHQARQPTWKYTDEGEYEASLTVWNSAGLNSTITYVLEVKEHWPPTAVAEPAYYGSNDFGVQFSGGSSYHVRDENSIVSYNWDFDDGTTSDEVSTTHVFSEGDRIYDVTLTVTDNEGYSDTTHCDIRIDVSIPPESTVSFRNCPEDIDWFKEDAQGTLVSEDWSGVDKMFYRVDNGGWVTLDSSYTPRILYYDKLKVIGEGIHNLQFYAVDKYGNEEVIKSEEVKIDKTPPSINVVLNGTQNDGWFITPITVTLSGTDELSGLDKIVYKYDLAWREYTGPFVIPNEDIGGTYYLECVAIDVAGNNVQERIPISIDPPPDEPKIEGETRGQPGNNYEYSIVSTDSYIGDTLTYYIDWGDGNVDEWTESAPSGVPITVWHTWEEETESTIKAKARDNLGAEGDWGTLFVRMPKNRMIFLLDNFLEKHPILFNLLRYCFLN